MAGKLTRLGRSALVATLALGCARAAKLKAPELVAGASAGDAVGKPPPDTLPAPRQPAAPAALARQRGWMPLTATGIPAFLTAHPEWDGRGVLIAILDSGIDPGVPGLDSTSMGEPKLLDLRDFSGEGAIALEPLVPEGDGVRVAGVGLAGFGRVRAFTAGGSWFGGVLVERRLGLPPAADLNANGTDGDSLALVVGRASDGWVVFADTDGDGSLANERPLRDYLAAGERFGWHRPGGVPPLQLAVNLASDPASPERPRLSLVFDTEAHGTHVAGIAAAYGIGGVAGFHGVAPGAQLLGLKISRNDYGGLTTTGSVLRALEHAIAFARTRGRPLVVNLSFGVGNEREGAARLDALVDSVLLAHPEVVFVTSAGNDGPGHSTLGFPGSLRQGITVGATQPAAFYLPPGWQAPAGDPLLFYSSRGGELAKPDLVAPGTAYSTVPRWDTGEEFKSGTSMAAPHVAGLAALLLSAARAEHRSVLATDVRRALLSSARPVSQQSFLDAGAGLPELTAAWQALRAPAPPATFEVSLADRPEQTAAYAIGRGDSILRFTIRRQRGTQPVDLRLTSDVPWLAAPAALRLDGPEATVALSQRAPGERPGSYTGVVRAEARGVPGPLFYLVSTVVIPARREAAALRVNTRLVPGGEHRVVFAADSGRPFRVRVASGAGEQLAAALHQPGGQPILGEHVRAGGADTAAAVHEIDGRDARRGWYEVVAVAPPGEGASARIEVDHAPLTLALAPAAGDAVLVRATARTDSTARGALRAALLGGERSLEVSAAGVGEARLGFPLPAWARTAVVDLQLSPEQWPRFTDFGLSLLDASGRILEKSPANYAWSRLTVELPARTAPDSAIVSLAPGFAEPGSRERWTGRVTIRLLAEEPVLLEAPEAENLSLPPSRSLEFPIRAAGMPWVLPERFAPLALFLLESGGVRWTWELPLPARAVAPP